MTDSPIQIADEKSSPVQPEVGIALCLSGGGYRAMLFHIGSLWRLYEAQQLKSISRFSSVSGGSIIAAQLGLKWSELSFNPAKVSEDFIPKVAAPLRALARETIDRESFILGHVLPGGVSGRIAKAYDEYLFHGATLQNLPDEPRFVINATNIQSGVLWRFSKPHMWDYRVGKYLKPDVSLATAVAASSAFPPVLSPLELQLDPKTCEPNSGDDLQREPFTSRVVLSDGGVYDNLGLETAWKRYNTILVSDGGAKTQPEEEPHRDPIRHSYRVFDLIDNQVRSLRKRQLIASYCAPASDANHREGAYWGIRTDIRNYGVALALDCPLDKTHALAAAPTRLKRIDDTLQEKLINWGYAVCDAALRKHVDDALALGRFPYPDAGV